MPRYPLQFQSTDQNGHIIVDGTVTITLTGTDTAAVTYSASSGGTDDGGVYTTDADGRIKTWLDDADYSGTDYFRVTVSGPRFVTQVMDDIIIMPIASAAEASLALDNLVAVAINTSLVSDTADTDDLGTEAIPWKQLFIGSGGISFEGTTDDAFQMVLNVTDPTSDRAITLPNANGTISLVASTEILTNKTLTLPTIGDLTNATHDHADAAGGGNTLLSPTIGDYTNANHDHGDGIGGGNTLLNPTIVDFMNATHDHADAAGGGQTLNSPALVTPSLGVGTATSIDFGSTTLLASRALTVDTGGVFNIVLASAAGDDFTINTDKFVLEGDTGNVSFGLTAPTARVHIRQESTTAAIPVLYLDQKDVDQEMVTFKCTVAEGNGLEAVGAKALTVTHFVKVNLAGVGDRYIEVGTIA